MAKVISVGSVATAGVLLAAGAAVNRLFRPFGTSAPRIERAVESPVLAFQLSANKSPDGPVTETVHIAPTQRAITPTRPARQARPASAVLTRRGASRKAWRCV